MARFGRFNSLAQLVLKLTSPGIPDIYQGNELWDFSLVDPDNRRPVDYVSRVEILNTLLPMLEDRAEDLDRQVADLLTHAIDGRIKLYVTARLLRRRRSHPELFKLGSYHSLTPVGARAEAVCVFERRYEQRVLIVAACFDPERPRWRNGSSGRLRAVGDGWPLPDLPVGTRLKEVLAGRDLWTVAGQDGGPSPRGRDPRDSSRCSDETGSSTGVP